jgi:hypothetical protein
MTKERGSSSTFRRDCGKSSATFLENCGKVPAIFSENCGKVPAVFFCWAKQKLDVRVLVLTGKALAPTGSSSAFSAGFLPQILSMIFV